jgi:hypothetical protein
LKTLLSDRLFCFHAGLDEFVEARRRVWFNRFKSPILFRKLQNRKWTTRFSTFSRSHAFENLIEAAALFLENGIFSVIIPYKEEKDSWPCQWIWIVSPKNYSVKGTQHRNQTQSIGF